MNNYFYLFAFVFVFLFVFLFLLISIYFSHSSEYCALITLNVIEKNLLFANNKAIILNSIVISH